MAVRVEGAGGRPPAVRFPVWSQAAKRRSNRLPMLPGVRLAPTTAIERVPSVAKGGGGFLYYISRTGVTGASTELRGELGQEVGRIRDAVELPVAVGFGISTPDQAASVAGLADGVVVGSALIKALEAEGPAGAGRFLAGLRQAMDEAADRG